MFITLKTKYHYYTIWICIYEYA